MTMLHELLATYPQLSHRVMDVLALMSQFTGLSTAQCMVMTRKDNPQVYESLSQQCSRLAEGYPLAYLQGFVTVKHRDYLVTEDTLIPRPETELWLRQLAVFRDRKKPQQWLECGTGSGWVAIEMALLTAWQITAMERCPKALKVAKLNALKHQAEITWLQHDWSKDWPIGQIDGVFANPPYIPEHDPHLEGGIRYEPKTALVASDNGLSDIVTIIHQARSHLKHGGWLVIEHGFDQALAVKEALRLAGFGGIQTWQDEYQNDRMTLGSFQADLKWG